MAAYGNLRNGLTNAMDGSEDHWICRASKEFWDSMDMASLRASAVSAVQAAFEKNELVWSLACIAKLTEPFPDGVGRTVAGQDVDGALSEGEGAWESEQEAPLDSDEEIARSSALAPLPDVAALVVPEKGDTADEIERTRMFAIRLNALEKLKAAAEGVSLQQVAGCVNGEMHKLRNMRHLGSQTAAPIAALGRLVHEA